MNAQHKQPHRPLFSGNFDSKLKEALNKVKGISYVEKVKLYNSIVGVCTQMVEDCTDSLTAALYMALHDEYGFGQQRINRLKDCTQEMFDSYVSRYDIGTLFALYRDLEARGIKIKPRVKE